MIDAGGIEEPERHFPPIAVEEITSSRIAAQFLDVNPTRAVDWFDAVGRVAAFRVGNFGKYYSGLRADILSPEWPADAPNPYRIGDDKAFRNAFIQEGRLVASKLHAQAIGTKWSEADYGPRQIDAALTDRPVRFDKAVITCLALNNIAQAFALDHKWSFGRHSMVASIFWFRGLLTILRKIALDEERRSSDATDSNKMGDGIERRVAELIEEMSDDDDIGQDVATLRMLAGLKAEGPIEVDPKVGPYLASFPTQMAILNFLLGKEVDQGIAEVGKERRTRRIRLTQVIVQREPHGPKRLAASGEKVAAPSRVTHGPYRWPGPDPASPEEHWPPKIKAKGNFVITDD